MSNFPEIDQIIENFGTLHFTTKQKGRGRQALYCEDIYIMDVYPNVKEHFGILSTEEVFQDPKTSKWHDASGNPVDDSRIYSDLDAWLTQHLRSSIIMRIEDMVYDERESLQ